MRDPQSRFLLSPQRGTYAVILACSRTALARIGKLGRMELRPGFYAYVGSALGPGGVRARLHHHLRIAARPHWHIDYLRAFCDVVEVWVSCDPGRQEHVWAKAIGGLPTADVPMPGFGASDCKCAAHLFWLPRRPSIQVFRRQVQRRVSRLVAPKVPPANCGRS